MTGQLEAAFRELVRDVVRDEIRAALIASDATPTRNAADSYLSVTKAARLADVAPGTLRAWVRAGRLTAKRAGRVLRISRAELERFLSGAPDHAQQAETRRRAARILDRERKSLHAVS